MTTNFWPDAPTLRVLAERRMDGFTLGVRLIRLGAYVSSRVRADDDAVSGG